MPIHGHENQLALAAALGHRGGTLLGPAQGAARGFCLGISFYDQAEYGPPGVHEDQEGFYVLEGHGTARVGGEEFPVSPGSVFLAARGVPHALRRAPDSGPLKVLWAHGAV